MRRLRALLLLSLGLLAGCGKNAVPAPYDLGPCGAAGEHCCEGDTCAHGILCAGGFCPLNRCGAVDESCCNGNCDANLPCVDGVCRSTCGHVQEPCCGMKVCNDPNTACSSENVCQNPARATGAPCTTADDCDGNGPVCILADPNGSWPDGYCASTCDARLSDPTGRNPECPGDNGVCVSLDGKSGTCFAGCTDTNGDLPCRLGYSCFDCPAPQPCSPICRPSDQSQCDPTLANSCEPNRSCVRSGPDDVGVCATTCDLFAQGCDQSAGPAACYIVDDTGQGYCVQEVDTVEDGGACFYDTDCRAGLTCVPGPGLCRPFCGGPMKVTCGNGKQCVDFSAQVPIAVAGTCNG